MLSSLYLVSLVLLRLLRLSRSSSLQRPILADMSLDTTQISPCLFIQTKTLEEILILCHNEYMASVYTDIMYGKNNGGITMARKYVYTNQKGGVTKTTAAINTAVMATLSGKRSLLVDMDGQGNSTWASGYNPDYLEHTIYKAMQGTSTIQQALRPTYFDPKTGIFFDPSDEKTIEILGIGTLEDARRGPDLLPNNILAGSADSELQDNPTWGILLRDLLAELDGQYDEMHIDTNPSLGKMTINALYTGTDIVIPMTPEAWSMQGMIQLVRSVVQAQKANKALRVAGIAFTRVRYASHQDVMRHVREVLLPDINKQYPDLRLSCFDAVIHEGALFGEAVNSRTNVILANPYSSFALEYWRLYGELLNKTGGEGVQVVAETYKRLYQLYQADFEKKQAKKQARTGAGKAE
jgi:chromosome partitioning protein